MYAAKKITILMIALLGVLGAFAAPASAREMPRIAVYVTGNIGEDEKSALGTRILASLIRSGRYRGIERSAAFLAEIEREHETQRSGAIDDAQISALGRQFGVRYVCIATITPAFGAYQISARIIDVETAEILHIGETSSPLWSLADLQQASDEVVRDMFGIPPPQEDLPPQEPEPQKVTLTFNTNGGSPSYIPPITGESGSTLGQIYSIEPTRQGYIFAGWFSGQREYPRSTPIYRDVELTARWERDRQRQTRQQQQQPQRASRPPPPRHVHTRSRTNMGIRFAYNQSHADVKIYTTPTRFTQNQSAYTEGHGGEVGGLINVALARNWSFVYGNNVVFRNPVSTEDLNIRELGLTAYALLRAGGDAFVEAGGVLDIPFSEVESRSVFDYGYILGFGFGLGSYAEIDVKYTVGMADYVELEEQAGGILTQYSVGLTIMFGRRK